ncbi:MAG: isochorismatase family protein [Deltaproteobacteria bacterium]
MRHALLLLTTAACASPASSPTASRDGGPAPGVPLDAGAHIDAGAYVDAGTKPGEVDAGTAKSLGVLVIDVQEVFVDVAVNRDKSAVIDRSRGLLRDARAADVPVLISFEASMSGGHALHADLETDAGDSQRFVKTKFDATQLRALATALREADRTHWLVIGAETDVCVMQTVLGLRALGYGVLLHTEAVLSSEPNASPALRRMAQAGVTLVDHAAARARIAGASLPPVPNTTPRVVEPLGIAIVLNGFTEEAITATNDPLRAQKEARLHELLIVAEWFELSVFAAGPLQLPAAFANDYSDALLPIASLASADVEQVAIAGTDVGLDALDTFGRERFLVEDALLSPRDDPENAWTEQYAAGATPITYKSLYYGLVRSVELDEWPSPRWIARDPIYYPRTRAPEDLPAMPFTP